MLQHGSIDRVLLPEILRQTLPWNDMAGLETAANHAVALLRASRLEQAENYGAFNRLQVQLDARLHTSQAEYLDEADFPARRRVRIVQSLHRFNTAVFAYQRFFAEIKPYLRRIAATRGRPPRILELASGAGEFALGLARLARQENVEIDVTGSDYFVEHVEACRHKAAERGLPVEFIELNAFDMQQLAAGSYDLIIITQSIHHFSPGQVAMMIEQSMRVASTGFIGIDGRRALGIYGIVSSFGLLLRSRDFIHDALISARKFYTDSELELIARIATPGACIQARPAHPGYSVLTVLH